MITILIAEDDNLVAKGLRSLLEKEDDFKVIAEACNGSEVLELLLAGTRPNILLSDLSMSGMDGLGLVENVKALYPDIRSIILSITKSPTLVQEAMNVGACGFLHKQIHDQELKFAIRQVHSGSVHICSQITAHLLDVHTSSYPKKSADEPGIKLSERELDVLRLVCEGHTNFEMAETLFLSRRTVEGHRRSLLAKTNTKNTASLIRYAIVNGIIT
jgi:DNA-binding NarL/FixJ family response regulator